MRSLLPTIPGWVAARLGVLLAGSFSGYAQTSSVSAYGFAASQSAFPTIAQQGLGSVRVADSKQDENDSRSYPLPFPFVCGGGAYTHFKVTFNGELQLGPAAGIVGPVLAPFYDPELNGDPGQLSYSYFGTASNRTFVMELAANQPPATGRVLVSPWPTQPRW